MVRRTCCSTDRPRPPYSVGSAYPYRRISLACGISRAGISSDSSMPASAGITSWRMKSRSTSISSSNSVAVTMSPVSGQERVAVQDEIWFDHAYREGATVPASEGRTNPRRTDPPRRAVIAAVPAVLAAAAALDGCTSSPKPQPRTYRFFTSHQAAVVEDATARIAPGPADDPAEAGHPRARPAGVPGSIPPQLAAPRHAPP